MQDIDMLTELQKEHMINYPIIKIEDEVLDFDLEIYDPNKDDIVRKNISSYKKKWLILFFYPADFTFVCPTELKDLNKSFENIKALNNVELLVVSTDTVFSHKRWIETESLLAGFKISMVSDRTTALSRYFGILNHNS
jgi:alkyl hydroperoxide reductase subunit AhpC